MMGRLQQYELVCFFLFITFAFPLVGTADILTEEFSGTGAFSASGGGAGFDMPGWFVTGNSGVFSTNSFGESVYEVESNAGPSQVAIDGLVRSVGTTEFDAEFEFSNPMLDPQNSVALGINDFTVGAFASLSFQANSGGSTSAIFFIDDAGGGGSQVMGLVTTADSVDRGTLYLRYRDDQVNGGGKFDAFVEFNESGNVQLVASIDGNAYSQFATANRSLSITTRAFSGKDSFAEFDRFSIASVPEPSSAIFLLACCGGWLGRRRRR